MPFFLTAQCLEPFCVNFGHQSYHTNNTSMDFSTQTPIVVDIIFHLADDLPITLTETDFLRTIAYLNGAFNPFNIFIKYQGFDNTLAVAPNLANKINVNIVNATSPQGGTINMKLMILPYVSFIENNPLRSIIVHELGHTFGLEHTFNGTDYETRNFVNELSCNGGYISQGHFPTPTGGQNTLIAEHVTRDESDLVNYNATTAGDFVSDTPATYKLPNVCNDVGANTTYYLQSDEVVDLVGVPYENIDTRNFMSYNDPYFLNHFTNGQGVRMRENLLNNNDYFSIKNTVASLYQPYKIIESPMQYFFQPGFGYEFVNCAAGCIVISSDYDNVSFNYDDNHITNYSFDKLHTPYSDIYQSENMAVRILQIDDTQPRKCYSVTTKGIGGIVVTFNENIINSNFTTTVKDSTAINSPNLIQNLPNGLYIIKKDYNDGSQEQQTILKEND